MDRTRYVHIGVSLLLSFCSCVTWAAVETAAKAGAWWITRFNVAMGLIGVCFMGLLTTAAFYAINSHARTVRASSPTCVHPEDATIAHGTAVIPPLLLVEIEVEVCELKIGGVAREA